MKLQAGSLAGGVESFTPYEQGREEGNPTEGERRQKGLPNISPPTPSHQRSTVYLQYDEPPEP